MERWLTSKAMKNLSTCQSHNLLAADRIIIFLDDSDCFIVFYNQYCMQRLRSHFWLGLGSHFWFLFGIQPWNYIYHSTLLQAIWATTWQNQQNGCASTEDSDQPGHPLSLIRVFAVRMKKPWVLSYPLSPLRRLWSDWADESSLGAHSFCPFCHVVAHFIFSCATHQLTEPLACQTHSVLIILIRTWNREPQDLWSNESF